MSEFTRHFTNLPPEQQAIRDKCFHPTGTFIEFKKEEIEQSIPNRFEKIVARYPDRIAVKTENHALTYAELNATANRVARAILAQQGESSRPIALFFEQGAQVISTILGVLKAGKIYVPLDPSYPFARLTYLLEDSQAGLVVTNNKNLSSARELVGDTIKLINIDTIDSKVSDEDLRLSLLSDTPAYILYTSGSTGQPKGVVQNHHNVLHDCMSYTNNIHTCTADRVGLLASVCVGASVHYLFGALLNGAALYPLDLREKGLTHLAIWLIREQITFFQLSANVFRYFLDSLTATENFPELRLIALGSARVTKKDVELYKRHFSPTCILLNRLSTTESNTIRWNFIDKNTQINEDTLPVGYAVEDKEVLLLGEGGAEVGSDEIGEIAVRSRYLAPGYWRRPELTRAAFLPDPKCKGERTYCTGDLGRMRQDGCLEHVGRKDFRVKIRGFTVEVAEIERALLEHPAITELVVVTQDDKQGDKRLVAYIIPNQGRTLSISELRSFLKSKLPDYMVPSAFIELDALPLTPSGKVNREALPSPDLARSQLEDVFVGPRNSTEKELAKIWADVLGLDRVGVHDNFFNLGGHSLLATAVLSRIRDCFQVEVPLHRLFETPSIAALANCVGMTPPFRHGNEVLPIQPVLRNRELPLSFPQQRLWFLNQLDAESPVYNEPTGLRLRGVLNIEALQKTLDAIVARHEALRTIFSSIDGHPVQMVSEGRSVDLPLVDLCERPPAERESEFQRLAVETSQRPFNLRKDLMLRAALFRMDKNDHVVLLVTHDIACDGWSNPILFREILAYYKAFCVGSTPTLPDLPIQYADFALWQRQWLQGEILGTRLSYWKKQLSGIRPLEFPTDRPRPRVQTLRGARQSFILPKSLSDALKALSGKERVTLFMTLLAAFQVLLHRYTGQDEIVLGCPIANRTRPEVEGLIGVFTNTLVLRTNLSGTPTFKEVLSRVRQIALDAYEYQDLPFEMLVEELNPQRNLSRTPLFQVMLNFQNRAKREVNLSGLTISGLTLDSGTVKFDLTLSMVEDEEGLGGTFAYNTDLFDAITITRMAGHFQTLLEGVASNPEQRISQLPLLNQTERHHLLVEWNDTKKDYPQGQCIHELFEAQVERKPDAVAAAFEDEQLTYRQLNQRASKLAHYLRKLGVGPEVLVGICVERSLEMIVAILGVLKAGGAYVPLDPEYPKERLGFMLRDAQTSILLTQERLLERLPESETRCLCIDTSWESIGQESKENLRSGVSADDLAYVIYTSGSTGTPKGVAVTHRAVNRLVMNTDYAQLTCGDVVAQAANFSFDATTFELWGALLHGARLVVIPQEDVLSPTALAAQIENEGITAMFLTTALFNQLVENIPSALGKLHHLLFGGEAVDPRRVKELLHKSPPKRLLHVYGPTETTTFASWYLVKNVAEDAVTIPIGRPIANTQIYLLDQYLQPVPVGVPGELYIGEDGLALGYHNRPELTAEKFIPHPFSAERGARLYKTGDLARYLSDGDIEFIGRIDHQVKIRGFRIELGEIESVLSQHPAVQRTVVVAREDVTEEQHAAHNPKSKTRTELSRSIDPSRASGLKSDKRLVAYVVPNQGSAPTTHELRSFLKQKLPEYMVPSVFVLLDTLPLTPNGKIDRKALPAPDQSRPELEQTFVAPGTPVEEIIAEIWAEVLKVEKVGIHDNFFDLGGHSLLATQVMSRLREALRVDLPLRALFEAPTIAELALRIEHSELGNDEFEELARHLAEVESLSEEEIERQLVEENG